MIEYDGLLALERMERAVQLVNDRLLRATATLEASGIAYALGGSNATSVWIASVDESAVRNARDVELVLLRSDFERAVTTLSAAGFVHTIDERRTRFVDGFEGKLRKALEITFGNEPVRGQSRSFLAPTPSDSVWIGNQRVLRLDRLVEFQLARFRLDDAVDVRDLIDVGLVDASWPAKFQVELAARLQHLLDTPDG